MLQTAVSSRLLPRILPATAVIAASYHVSVKDAVTLDLPSEDVTVCGWVKSARKQKELLFIDVNDGSSLQNLQVLASSAEERPGGKYLNLGCSVMIRGSIQESPHPGQKVEMRAREIRVLGECDPKEYPFKARKRHSPDYTRQFPHLRARTNTFSSLLRIRNTAATAIHEFFQERGFLYLHSPILSSSDCEGAGDLFEVKPARDDGKENFFGCKAYLTVSGQLHAEAIACSMSSVYTFGPTFRAEKSHTRRHLAEFHMVEAETVTHDRGLSAILELTESLYKHTVEAVLKRSSDDVKLFHDNVTSWEIKASVDQSLEQPFKHLTYSEAIDVLAHSHKKEEFQYEPKWGSDLQTEHEQYLVAHCGQLPVFITDFPASLKPFYARVKDDNPKLVSAMDLLVPQVGEVVGGTLREERPDILHDKLERSALLDDYQWYLDLRRFGTVPHGGFGLGFERFLQAILGVGNIRDVTPFPRFLGSCQM